MKISNSKKELARIISENGGWRDGEFAAQDKTSARIDFYEEKPWINGGQGNWNGEYIVKHKMYAEAVIPNWHQTILSRAEYFFLYREQGLEDALNEDLPDADGWIEYDGAGSPYSRDDIVEAKWSDGDFTCSDNFGHGPAWIIDEHRPNITHHRLHKPAQASATEKLSDAAVSTAKDALMSDSIEELVRKPTIEQLAADYRNKLDYANRKQQEADDAKAVADAALGELERAGEALGLVIGITKPEPELVVTDWRDLRVGDEISVQHLKNVYSKSSVLVVGTRKVAIRNHAGAHKAVNLDEINWRFIRRP